jgi:hypothetical protein
MGVGLLVAPARAQDGMTLQVAAGSEAPQVYTLADLDAMPQISFVTGTIWTEGKTTYSGVSLKYLVETVTDNGATVEMVALNDYAVTVPLDEISDDWPIVATRADGAPMSVRDKGPYWVIYPYDQSPAHQTETTYARSIWQLAELRIDE